MTKSWISSPEDQRLILELKTRTGMQSDSDIMRLALRRFAQAEGILENRVSVGQTPDAAKHSADAA